MNKIVRLILLATFLLFLSGCWDQNELNELSLVTGLGIDKGKEHKYLLTAEVLNPPSLDPDTLGAQTASIIYSLEGDSIAELTKKMNVGFTRKLIFSHLRTVIVSKELAKEGNLVFIDFFEADREIRNDFNLIIANNTTARNLLKITYPIQRVSSLKFNTQLATMIEEWGGAPEIRMKDYINALVSPGREPVLVNINLDGSPEKGDSMENMEEVDLHSIATINGLSIFNGMKYQGELPIKHTRNYLLLQNKLKKTSITAPCGDKDKVMTARIIGSNTDIAAKYQNDQPHFDIHIDLEGRIELIQCQADITKTATYLEIEEKYNKTFENEIKETIEILQEQYGLDIFGLGEHMERQDYKNFKKVRENWNEEFAKADINVNVNLKLRRAGLITNPVFEDIQNGVE